MSSKTYAIKCTHCAAPLDILGGGRVASITCKYCHSLLDLTDHYKVLATFNNIQRPDAPFEIGMKGRIKGVEWSIIGWISYKTAEFPSEEWDEFFLYSPTHGYAWLIQEDKSISFSKRVRNFDVFDWQTKFSKTIFYNKGHYIQKESAYDVYINYVEGTLSWIAKSGDKITCRDYYGVGKKIINIEQSHNETEVYLTEKLNPVHVYNSFSVPKEKQVIKQGIIDTLDHASDNKDEHIKYFEEPQEHSRFVLIGFVLIFLLLISLTVASKFYNSPVYETNFTSNIEQNITIDSSGFLTSLYFIATGSGLSANLKIWLYKEGKKVFYIDSKNVYFDKQDLGESWRYGSNAIIYLKLDKGTYKLIATKDNPNISIYLNIQQNVIRLKYILPLLIIILELFIMFYYHLDIYKKFLLIVVMISMIATYNVFGFEALFRLLFLYIIIYEGYILIYEGYNNYYNWNNNQ